MAFMHLRNKFIALALGALALCGYTGEEDYLQNVKTELQKEWPANRTINLVFHGHSVPSGYYRTPVVNTLSSYPYLFLKMLKDKYPHAVVNIIVTAKGGENAVQGAARFGEALQHKPDVLMIDYALNDRPLGLEKAYKAWDSMIVAARAQGIKVILLTPSPDLRENFADSSNALLQHSQQVRQLAQKHRIGLADSYRVFDSIYRRGEKLDGYMSQINHPNEKGHTLIAKELIKWF